MSLPIVTTTSLSLEQQLERISLEAGFRDNITDLLSQYLPGIYSKLSDLSLALTVDTKKREYKELAKLNTLGRHGLKYDTLGPIADRLIVIPIGLDGYLLDFIPVIQTALKDTTRLVTDSLVDFSFAISRTISDSEYKKSLSDRSHIYKDVDKQREKILQSLSTFYNTDNPHDKLPIKDIIEQVSDIPTIIDRSTDLTSKTASKELLTIKDEVDKVVDLMKMLTKRIESNDMDDLNSMVAKSVAEESYVIAKVIELLTVVRSRADTVIETAVVLAKMTQNKT